MSLLLDGQALCQKLLRYAGIELVTYALILKESVALYLFCFSKLNLKENNSKRYLEDIMISLNVGV